jgi:hypothetical protein
MSARHKSESPSLSIISFPSRPLRRILNRLIGQGSIHARGCPFEMAAQTLPLRVLDEQGRRITFSTL